MPEGTTLELEKPADSKTTAETVAYRQSADKTQVKAKDDSRPVKTAEDILEKLKDEAKKQEAKKLKELLDKANSHS